MHIPHPIDYTTIKSAIRELDLLGMGFLVSWLTLLIIALNLGGDAYAWNSPVIIGLFAGAFVAFVAFVLAERYAAKPVVPLGLYVRWASRNVPIMTVVRALLFFHLYTTVCFLFLPRCLFIFLTLYGRLSMCPVSYHYLNALCLEPPWTTLTTR